jgi:hypothetical protein
MSHCDVTYHEEPYVSDQYVAWQALAHFIGGMWILLHVVARDLGVQLPRWVWGDVVRDLVGACGFGCTVLRETC